MSPLLLKEVIKPYQAELDSIKLDLSKVSHLRMNYKGEEIAFVDLVIEGGGVKGVAVSGAIFALEYLGIRFRKIAGTSAGAINAAFLAIAAENLAEKRAEKLANVVFNMNLLRFVDGGKGAEAFVKSIMNQDNKILDKLERFISITRNIDTVMRHFGLNPGTAIHKWLETTMARFNKQAPLTVADITKRMHVPDTDIRGELQVVTTDITNRRKAIFPRDLAVYVKTPNEVHVADLIRASLSIPFFFEPFRLGQFSGTGGYNEPQNLFVNDQTTFIDGAMVSNFPLDIFDKPNVPKCPTIGVLFDNQTELDGREIHSILDYFMAIFETMHEHGDRSYMFSSRSRSRIIKISNLVQQKPVRSMYFDLSRETTAELFGNGIRAAIDFIKTWDFDAYISEVRKK
jgi:NTE family protein